MLLDGFYCFQALLIFFRLGIELAEEVVADIVIVQKRLVCGNDELLSVAPDHNVPVVRVLLVQAFQRLGELVAGRVSEGDHHDLLVQHRRVAAVVALRHVGLLVHVSRGEQGDQAVPVKDLQPDAHVFDHDLRQNHVHVLVGADLKPGPDLRKMQVREREAVVLVIMVLNYGLHADQAAVVDYPDMRAHVSPLRPEAGFVFVNLKLLCLEALCYKCMDYI